VSPAQTPPEAAPPPPSLPPASSPAVAPTPLPPETPTITPPADVQTMVPVPDVVAEKPKPKIVPPVEPLPPPRAPAAILRVLDKVTAETMAFSAPIGRRVRYKSLVFEVKACVTRGPSDPQPQPSAYLVITSDAGATGAAVGPRQLFKGWMFANAPGVNALKHPVYDAWLVACNAAAPAI